MKAHKVIIIALSLIFVITSVVYSYRLHYSNTVLIKENGLNQTYCLVLSGNRIEHHYLSPNQLFKLPNLFEGQISLRIEDNNSKNNCYEYLIEGYYGTYMSKYIEINIEGTDDNYTVTLK